MGAGVAMGKPARRPPGAVTLQNSFCRCPRERGQVRLCPGAPGRARGTGGALVLLGGGSARGRTEGILRPGREGGTGGLPSLTP